MVAIGIIYYVYTPISIFNLNKNIDLSDPLLLDDKRIDLAKSLEKSLSFFLPKNTGKTPTLLHLFLGNQRKLLDLRFNQAIKEIKDTKVNSGEIRIWSLMNMGVVIKTNNKTIAIDVADMPFSGVQKKLTDIVDLVLITHSDSDHYDSTLLKTALKKGKTVIFPQNFNFLYDNENFSKVFKLNDGEKITSNGMDITAFQTDHRNDNNFFEPNAWYLIEIDGFKIIHTGDGWNFKDKNKKESLKNIKIDLFLSNVKNHPYNIRDVKPKVVVPLHLYKFMHSREELAESTFDYAINLYSQYQKDLQGIEKIYLFPGESFTYPLKK